MVEKNIVPDGKHTEKLISTVKKDLLWLLVSLAVAVGAAFVANMFITI